MSRRRRCAAVLCALGLFLVIACAATGDVVLCAVFTAVIILVAASLPTLSFPPRSQLLLPRAFPPRAPPLS